MNVDKQRKWSILDSMECCIAEKFPNGTHLACNVCSVFDMEERKFGVVKMRAPFWLGYFRDHLKSARHKSNCEKKALHKEANQRRTKSGVIIFRSTYISLIYFTKWFPASLGDGPSWPVKDKEHKQYDLGICAVDVNLETETVEFKEDVNDGHNVRNLYRMMKIN